MTNTTCTVIYPNVNETKLMGSFNDTNALGGPLSDSWKGWNYFGYTLLSVQHLCAFVFILHIGKIRYIKTRASLDCFKPF